MSGMIDVGKVTGRRQLHFTGLDDIRAEVERLAASKDIKTLGNLSAGQILAHLALAMEKSIDGFQSRVPVLIRWFARLFLKRKLLTQPMATGYTLPPKAVGELIPAAASLEQGLQSIWHALYRLGTESKRSPHLVLGALSADEWVQFHCRHSELHLSFLVPLD